MRDILLLLESQKVKLILWYQLQNYDMNQNQGITYLGI